LGFFKNLLLFNFTWGKKLLKQLRQDWQNWSLRMQAKKLPIHMHTFEKMQMRSMQLFS